MGLYETRRRVEVSIRQVAGKAMRPCDGEGARYRCVGPDRARSGEGQLTRELAGQTVAVASIRTGRNGEQARGSSWLNNGGYPLGVSASGFPDNGTPTMAAGGASTLREPKLSRMLSLGQEGGKLRS